jgi:hypothetical protein
MNDEQGRSFPMTDRIQTKRAVVKKRHFTLPQVKSEASKIPLSDANLSRLEFQPDAVVDHLERGLFLRQVIAAGETRSQLFIPLSGAAGRQRTASSLCWLLWEALRAAMRSSIFTGRLGQLKPSFQQRGQLNFISAGGQSQQDLLKTPSEPFLFFSFAVVELHLSPEQAIQSVLVNTTSVREVQ